MTEQRLEVKDALAEISAHERECAVRYENIERRLESGSKRFDRIEHLIYGIYVLVLGSVLIPILLSMGQKMIAEISAIVAGVNMASNALKEVAGTADDLSTIGVFLSKLGGAEVELAKAQNTGKLSEADAIKAALARKQIADTMQEVKDLFIVSGNGHLYQQCMQEMANARKAKQDELARAVIARRRFRAQMTQYALVFMVVLILVPATVGGLLAWLMNR